MEENKIKDDLDVVMDCVEKIFLVKQDRIRSRTRKMDAAFARHAYSVVCRDCTRRTYQEIGDSINRDHSTILYSYNEGRNISDLDPVFKARVDMCKEVFRRITKESLEESESDILKKILEYLKNN